MGDDAACAVRDGALFCWGSRFGTPLGEVLSHTRLRVTDPPRAPFRVVLPDPAASIAMSANDGMTHACVLADGGNVYCWGTNRYGELGQGTCIGWLTHREPLLVSLPGPARRIAASSGRACAELEDRTIVCWGAPESTPRLPCPGALDVVRGEYGEPLTDVQRLEAGAAIDRRGVLHRWDHHGRAHVVEWGPVIDVAVSDQVLCALRKDGSVRCEPTSGEVLVLPASTRGTAIACGGVSCALLGVDGALHRWHDLYRFMQPGATEPPTFRTDARTVAVSDAGGCVDGPDGIRCWGLGAWGAVSHRPMGDEVFAVTLPED